MSSTGAPDGQVLGGRYEMGAVLGRGGMAEVRAGWDLRLGRAVAIKTLLPGLAEEPDVRRRFEGEARAAARLAHPNAVAVFDVGEERGVPFLVMEQVVGPTLEEELASGPLDSVRLRRLGEELLAALSAAHSAGLIHRDVKPANILMAPDGSAKVADFGIAKAVVDEGAATRLVDLTTAGQAPGTLAYMAPERLAGQPATVQSDIYSVGVVLYESLTGARPFAAPTPVAVIRAIDRASPAPLQECCPAVDPVLVAAVERAMAKEPEDRFVSAAEMSAALGAARSAGISDAPTVLAATPSVTSVTSVTPVPAVSLRRPGWRRAAGTIGRHRIASLASVAVLAVALIAVAAGRDNPQVPPAGPTVVTPTATTAVNTAVPTAVTTVVTASPLPENRTSTSTPTARAPGGGKGKEKGKK